MVTSAVIQGGRVLSGDRLSDGSVHLEDGRIVAPRGERAPDGARLYDAEGCLVLPGIVDIHGDAFERQILPRPKVHFPLEIALRETDRQLVANGVTTAFYGVTVSWEPGLRSLATAHNVVDALTRLRPLLSCDTRLHIRWETFALEAIDAVARWLETAPKPILAFNDHTSSTIEKPPTDRKLEATVERAGISLDDYVALLAAIWRRRGDVPAAIDHLAHRARAAGCILLAHDEKSVEERECFRALGARSSEFPMNRETARAARIAGEHTVFGAPNIVRGGSHDGRMDATQAVSDGLCTVLTSDYYYPAPLLAAFKLTQDGRADFAAAWRLVAANAAEAAGLPDRGVIEPGRRGDLIIVDDSEPSAPRVRATFVAGRRVYATH